MPAGARPAASEQDLDELSSKLRRLKQALIDDDDELLDGEFGGFSKALSLSPGRLEERLKRKADIAGYEAAYDVWLSPRIRPKGENRNPLSGGAGGKPQRSRS